MNREFRASLKGTTIAVTVAADGSVSLAIDGVTRAQRAAAAGSPADCYLTTSIQTDYEYHALVEAWVTGMVTAVPQIELRVDGTSLVAADLSADGDTPGSGRERP